MKKIFLFCGVMLALPGLIFGNPDLSSVVSGEASVEESGDVYNLRQNTDQLIAEFHSFNIAAQETTNVHQPSSSSTALFRILDQDPSKIFGSLKANGNLFLTNPNGIFFGPDSQVNVGGLVASTLGISDENFLNRHYVFAGEGGLIHNQGTIAAENGTIALLGRMVVNEGTIRAHGGSVALAAGAEVTLALDAEGLVSVAVSGSAAGALDKVINHTGLIAATTAVEREGAIYLVSGGDGIVSVDGSLDASGKSAGETGGTLHVLGKKVGLLENAEIDASGHSGGGTVLIGGDFQGKNPEIRNAKRTYVDGSAAIRADALNLGDGGKVIVWADERTYFGGEISARGGSESGDGGFAEVSASDLNYQGFTDLRAPNGEKGKLLLDPKNITIDNVGGSAVGANDTFAENAAANAALLNTDVAAALNGANLTLQANNDITVSNAIDASGNAGNGNLTFQAGRSIAINADITLRGSFTATANNAGAQAANRDAGDAAFTMGAARLINTSAGNGAVSINYGNGPNGNDSIGAMTVGQLNTGTGIVTINSTDNNESENLDLDGQINSGAIDLTGETVRFDANINTTNGGGLTVTNGFVTDGSAGVTLNLDGVFVQDGANNNNVLWSIITTDDDINFLRPINLFADVHMSTGAGGGGNIIFQGAINNAQNLQLTAGTGNISFNSAVGAGAALTSILINSAGNVEFDSTVATTGTITQTTGSGTTNFDNTVTAGGNVNMANDAITFTAAGNINAGANSVTLNAETGAITGGTAAADITAGTVNLDAVTGIGSAGNTLQIAATTASIDNSGAGNVNVTNTPGANATVSTLTAANGTATYTQAGNRTLLITASTASGAISITNNGGAATDITVGNVNAGTSTAAINSGRDILESGADAAADVTGGTVNLTAANDIGTAGNPLEVTSTVLNATAGGTSFIAQVAASVVTGTFAAPVTTSLSSGDLTAQNLAVTGAGNNIALTASDGNVLLENVSAQTGTVTVQSSGNITGDGGSRVDVSGKHEVRLLAGGQIGSAPNPLNVQVTGSTIFASAGSETDGLSVNITGNVSREEVVFLNLPPGLVLYNHAILGGGNYEEIDTAFTSQYTDLLQPSSSLMRGFCRAEYYDFPAYGDKESLMRFYEAVIDDSQLV
jgi:filamentous hemagglutinin family protein